MEKPPAEPPLRSFGPATAPPAPPPLASRWPCVTAPTWRHFFSPGTPPCWTPYDVRPCAKTALLRRIVSVGHWAAPPRPFFPAARCHADASRRRVATACGRGARGRSSPLASRHVSPGPAGFGIPPFRDRLQGSHRPCFGRPIVHQRPVPVSVRRQDHGSPSHHGAGPRRPVSRTQRHCDRAERRDPADRQDCRRPGTRRRRVRPLWRHQGQGAHDGRGGSRGGGPRAEAASILRRPPQWTRTSWWGGGEGVRRGHTGEYRAGASGEGREGKGEKEREGGGGR